MTDYAPVIPPIGWSNSYSRAFVDLLAICARAELVPGMFFYSPAAEWFTDLRPLAARLMTRELVARINTGSLRQDPTYDPLIQVDGVRIGPRASDEFLRAAEVPYRAMTGGVVRFSVPVPRNGVPDTDLFVREAAIAAYQSELAAVLAGRDALQVFLNQQAEVNAVRDPIAAAAIASAFAAARAGYVAQLQAAYPDRGFA